MEEQGQVFDSAEKDRKVNVREIKSLVKKEPVILVFGAVIIPLKIDFIKRTQIKHRKDFFCVFGCQNYEDIIEKNRNLYCPYYSHCLNYAGAMNLPGFSCALCPHKHKKETPNDFLPGEGDAWDEMSSIDFLS